MITGTQNRMFEVEEHAWYHLAQTLWSTRVPHSILPRVASSWLLNISRDNHILPSLSIAYPCSTVLLSPQ